MRNLLLLFLFLALAASLSGCAATPGPVSEATPTQVEEVPAPALSSPGTLGKPLTPEQQLVQDILKKNGFSQKGLTPTVIVVNKLSRRLTLYRHLTPLKTYPIVLGADPYNDKLCQGDHCTPEGVYRIVSKYPHHKWSRFILLDYPNQQNWLKFAKAKKSGKLPPQVDIGGQVGIHGTEDDSKNLRGENWTKGCISLLNQHVEELYSQINDDTLVIIKK